MIDSEDIMGVLSPVWQTKRALSDKLYGNLKQLFDFAIAKKYRDKENPANLKGALGTLLTPLNTNRIEGGHYACVDYKQMPEFMAELFLFNDELGTKALIFSLLTVARSKAVRMITWNQIDFKNKIWTIPLENDKIKKQTSNRTIYLSKQAIELLNGISKDSSYVFHTTRGKNFSDAVFGKVIKSLNEKRVSQGKEEFVDKNMLDENGKPSPITQHGTARATFKIWSKSDELGNNRNLDADAVELCLLHLRKDPLKGAYDRSALEKERRSIMQQWADYCFSELKIH